MKRIIIGIAVVGIVLASVWYVVMHRGIKSGEVLVLCGGSMRAPMERLVREYRKTSGDTIVMSYGDSGEIVSQLRQTRRGDLLICHDPFMPYAAEQKLIADWAALAYFDVVIVVPKGNPLKINGLDDLALARPKRLEAKDRSEDSLR